MTVYIRVQKEEDSLSSPMLCVVCLSVDGHLVT